MSSLDKCQTIVFNALIVIVLITYSGYLSVLVSFIKQWNQTAYLPIQQRHIKYIIKGQQKYEYKQEKNYSYDMWGDEYNTKKNLISVLQFIILR